MNIILIGYRGTGKTTIARLLGERLGVPSFDSDPEIERRAAKTITEIFADHGEPMFRDMEAAAIEEILQRKPFVLATGGGAILRESTRKLLGDNGFVVWLTATPETILDRMQGDATTASTRPNLTSLPPLDEIVAMLERRHLLYADAAHATITTDGKSLDEIVDEIVRISSFHEPGPVGSDS